MGEEIASALGCTDAEAAEKLTAAMDTDGDGGVSYQELQAAVQAAKAAYQEQANEIIDEAFDAVDANGDGQVTVEEMAAATGMEVGDIQEAFDAVDTNKDGVLDKEEAKAALCPQDS